MLLYDFTISVTTLTTTKLFTMIDGNPETINTDPMSIDSGFNVTAEPAINTGAVSTYKIEFLKEGNWIVWSSHMITMMEIHNVYGYINGAVPKPSNSDPAQLKWWKHYNNVAQMLIKNNTSNEQMVHINQSDITTAAKMWYSLCAIHEVCGQSAITATKCTFYYTHATNKDSILNHIAEMCHQANHINQMGCKISDK
jgi:hypothetical protein